MALLLAILLAGLLGCGGDDDGDDGRRGGTGPTRTTVTTSPAAADLPRNICDVIGFDVIEAAIGRRPVAANPATDGQGGLRCFYLLGEQRSDQVSLIVYPERGRQVFDGGRTAATSDPVEGIGDAAYWRPQLGDLSVRVGERSFGVQLVLVLVPLPPEQLVPAAVTIAEPVVAALR